MDAPDETRLLLTEIRDLQRQMEKRQRSLAIATWIMAVCGVGICGGVLVEVSVVVLYLVANSR